MNIIICGLPGTGKTTLCKLISERFNYTYLSDYDILNKNGISFQNSYEIIDNDFFEQLNSFFEKEKPIKYVFDFCYSLFPERVSELDSSKFCVFYLGFAGVPKELLMKKMQKEKGDLSQSVFEERIAFLVEVSNKYEKLCKENSVEFISINSDREVIISELLKRISEKLEN